MRDDDAGTVAGRLKRLGIDLPAAPAPVASYVPAVRSGDRGPHARSAVGTHQLPFDIAVEIEMVVEVRRGHPEGPR